MTDDVASDIIGAVKVVLDTCVVLAGVLSRRGASHFLLRRLLEGKLAVAASVPLFVEYEAVLKRRETLRRTGWSVGDVDVLLDAVAEVVEPTVIRFLWRPGVADPDDQMVVECAASSRADMVVTFNIRHLSAAGREFGFRVVTPGRAVHVLSGKGGKP